MKKIFISFISLILITVLSACQVSFEISHENEKSHENVQQEENTADSKDNNQSNEEDEETSSDNDQKSIENVANTVINLIANKNMKNLADYVHTDKGVLFSPYVNVDDESIVFQKEEVESFFAKDNQAYEWGLYDGSGKPIKLIRSDYYNEFIYNKDFLRADKILINETKQRGNMVNNIKKIFPHATVVEFFIEGSEEYQGMDWASLNLVFEQNDNNEWKLVAIIHDQWTM